MRVAVLSDTHARNADVDALLKRVRPHLEGCDLILHAGDVTTAAVLDALGRIAPVEAVAGNMDGPEINDRWPQYQAIALGSHRVGLIHGWGAPNDLSRKVWERFVDADGQPTVQAIVFGHSHQPLVQDQRGVLMVNPGSAMDRRAAPTCTMAILDVAGSIEARILSLA